MKELLAEQRKYFKFIRNDMIGAGGIGSDYDFRMANLRRLREALKKHKNKLIEALREDLGKSAFESVMTEIALTESELSYTVKNLKNWMKPKRVRTPLMVLPGKSYVYPEPYGVSLIISPWNYPVLLPLVPLISSIAAGNCSVLKLSELSPNASEAVGSMLKKTFEPCYIAAVFGGPEVAGALLAEKFDYIFFTGSVRVGKIVMKAAAENLTPVTLELGGKSPCIVDKNADTDLAAKRIVWGKFLNAGQTCVAPDYILAHEDIRERLVEKMKFYIERFYTAAPLENPDYPKIINKAAFDRILSLINKDKTVYGGGFNEASLKIEPTIMSDITENDKVMESEIFGPILPIIKYSSLKDAEDFINSRPKPLALYVFTSDKKAEENIIEKISFGSGCVNDAVLQIGSPYLPFGGVGMSGMGRYHGKFGFDTFSHQKGILKKAAYLDIPLRYFPAGDKANYIDKFI